MYRTYVPYATEAMEGEGGLVGTVPIHDRLTWTLL
jgi:hypothetical protein